ncbi:MAG: DUF4421 domain-containing protein [Muribaculaceae bacterium]|nr:DUF4421 domain-containing protein [Muribaculaceae bacterium]
MGKIRNLAIIIIVLLSLGTPQRVSAISFDLDSIATWGKFPRFCVNVYRWGDHFFNGYDSTFVAGTGKRFNVKAKAETWTDYYGFLLDNRSNFSMISTPSTTAGIYLTYMAVSVGYDYNFRNKEKTRQRFNFEFSCALLAADLYFITNQADTRITRFENTKGDIIYPNLKFSGIKTSMWGLDAYYFFNHKHYSQGAAFSFSKFQRKSSGSPFAGIAFFADDYKFDFNKAPDFIKVELPPSWTDDRYEVKNKNYAFRIGYAYNWALPHRWTICISEAPTIGFKRGYINQTSQIKNSFSLSNFVRASVVYNYRNMFIGAIGSIDTGLIRDNEHALVNMIWTINTSIGYRFNLW